MAVKQTDRSFLLNVEQIDIASEQIFDFLCKLKLERKEAMRIRLNAENILLSWQTRFGANCVVHLSCYVRLGQPLIYLRTEGEPFDPLDAEVDELDAWKNALLAQMETQAHYTYSRGCNTVTFRIVKPKRSPLVLLLISLAAAIVFGLAGILLPNHIRDILANEYMAPITSTYLDVLGFFGIPLIFLSVALGIRAVDDIHIFDRIGKRMVGYYFAVLLLIILFAAGVSFPLFSFVSGDSLNIGYQDLLQIVLGWLPTNLIRPFADSNAMQLVLMGFIFGIGLLKLDHRANGLSAALDGLNNLLLWWAEWFTRLIPIFVFLIVVKNFWLGQTAELLPIWKPWILTTAIQMAAFLIMALLICKKLRIGCHVLLKKLSATFLIALGTNSCTASITENYACCAGKLGISSRIFGFGIPIGTSVFKPGSAIRLIVLSFYVASAYQVGISAGWVFTAVLMAVIFSVAVPAIPGGTLMFCPVLFAQLGLPAAALPAILATDILFDAIGIAFNQVFVQLALLQQAGAMEMLDSDILRRTVS